ncbi:MAG: hypothetical protein Q8916_00705 [Bacteroidota bacterium]|nr:hypothetical protein [Bacteroidota bacterium]MDP4228905.1 hypothetical protein [Bacteroidota bacterium]
MSDKQILKESSMANARAKTLLLSKGINDSVGDIHSISEPESSAKDSTEKATIRVTYSVK